MGTLTGPVAGSVAGSAAGVLTGVLLAGLALAAVMAGVFVTDVSVPPSRGLVPAALLATLLLIAGHALAVLPGRPLARTARGWTTTVAAALPLLLPPLPAMLLVVLCGTAVAVVDRRRRGPGMLADIVGTVAATATAVLLGAGTRTAGSIAPDSASWPDAWAGAAAALAIPIGAALVGVAVAEVVAAPRAGAQRRDRDPLTGLESRGGLQQHAVAAVLAAVEGGRPVGLLVLDLDRFQQINDGHGQRTGDQVLRLVAQRLVQHTRPCDVVARLGSDEFAVLVPGVGDIATLTDLAGRLRQALSERLDGAAPDRRDGVFGPGASIGIAVAPAHATTASQLMARADAALHAAKDSTTGIRVHDGHRGLDGGQRLGLISAVRTALDVDDIRLAYQPKVAMDPDGRTVDRMVGVEALLRLDDGYDAALDPGRVVATVEGTGLMGRLTAAVLDRALAQVARWLTAGERIPVAVNVSLRDLEDPDFADRTYAALVRAGVPGSLLSLEITERVLTGELSLVVRTMERLERIGVRMSLDDFGTGWSSLLLLRRLPVAEVKLDRAFVAGLGHEAADDAVVASVVDLTRKLGLTMVAEGVESTETLERLRGLGCDVVQGFLVSPPLPADEVVPWARRRVAERTRAVS